MSSPGEGRDVLLQYLHDAAGECNRKIQNGRVRDAEKEEIRMKWIRTLARVADAYRQLAKDDDLSEMSEVITELQNMPASPGSASAYDGGD